MQPYAATQKISARAAWRVSTTSGVIRLASTTGRPSSSALALTGDGSSFLPRPRTASGRVMASAISFPASTSEVSEGTAKSGVPINTIRIKDVSPQPKPRRLQITAESQLPSPSAITIQQIQIYPKTKRGLHQKQPSQQSTYQRRRLSLAQRHPGEPGHNNAVPGAERPHIVPRAVSQQSENV